MKSSSVVAETATETAATAATAAPVRKTGIKKKRLVVKKREVVVTPPLVQSEVAAVAAVPPITCPEDAYLSSLSVMERQTMEIARDQLESSFSLCNSIGYIEYMQTQRVNGV
jgi:hypothetical protein